MTSATLTIGTSPVFISCYNFAFSAGLIRTYPTTWPMEGSSRNFLIEKWPLVCRPQGNLHLHLKDFCKCDWPWALIWIFKRSVSAWQDPYLLGTGSENWCQKEWGCNALASSTKESMAQISSPVRSGHLTCPRDSCLARADAVLLAPKHIPVKRGIPWSMDANNDQLFLTEI